MKKIFLVISILFAGKIFAQDSTAQIHLVTFRSNLDFIIGEDCQPYTANRHLKPFSINKTETPYSLWYFICKKAEEIGYYFNNPGQAGSEGRRGAEPTEDNAFQPVTMINWYDAIIWCNALSELQGRIPCYSYDGKILRDSSDTAACDLCECDWNANGYRLPSEAEWEYAARRTKTGFQKGDLVSGQITDESEEALLYAWTSENANETRIVGTAGLVFEQGVQILSESGNANQAGIFDMSGNVMEFCWDWISDYDDNLPYGPKMGYERVSRGGSWSPYTMFVFASDRYSFDPNECYNYLGFRIFCSVTE